MKVCLHWQLDLIKLRFLRLFLYCFLFYSSISSLHLVLIRNTTLKLVYHTRIGAIYAPTTRPWVSLWCCRGDVCGGSGASGGGNTAPMECYGAGADDPHAAGLVCFDDVAGRAPARAPRTLWRLDDTRWTKVGYDRSQTDFERLLNVGQHVIRIFYAGGIAHQAITNPQPLAFLRRKFVVRHQRRLFH